MKDVHIPRNRNGGIFIDAENVKLHSNDFDHTEKLNQLTDTERSHVDTYISNCEKALDSLNKINQPIALTETSPWEYHYSTNRHHFPLKNYIIHAFPILKPYLISNSKKCRILECGCGTGSTLLPLMRYCSNENASFVGFDVSSTALSFFLNHPIAEKYTKDNRLQLFKFDTSGNFPQSSIDSTQNSESQIKRPRSEQLKTTLIDAMGAAFPSSGDEKFDVVLLVFVLSALPTLSGMISTLKQIREVIKPDGFLLFRDYALPDHNFFRFIKNNNNELGELFFKKGDSTTQLFFEEKFTKRLMKASGFDEHLDEQFKLQYHCNRIINRKTGKFMDKVFLNGVFSPYL
ncbi:unnamed protein product [Phytomonas sp. Hart1]|nr:unnamed protein product [Phytomonas sp. Hart1]|eukprot:CCW71850.1 unnamed protein product [Phytomonas sp. isolate Hart1]